MRSGMGKVWMMKGNGTMADPTPKLFRGIVKRKVPDRADQVKSPDWLWGREEWYNDRPDPRGVS